MGQAIARRVGPGNQLLLADFNPLVLDQVAADLSNDGYLVETHRVDVGSRADVSALADHAAALGEVRYLVHTAGVSPAMASTEDVLRIDLLGTALVTEVFGGVIAPGGAGVVIASMSGHLLPVADDIGRQLAQLPADELLAAPFATPDNFANPGHAYAFAKRANQLRVNAESNRWGLRGARLNSISPGVIATAMGRQELDGPSGDRMRQMVFSSGVQRLGTTDDIAAAASFLLSGEASFITGTDLGVDGGVVGAFRTGTVVIS
jgi:NAD(P)-dependent dehydrogenase (short-subunit alcohol dehydrogenase family)